MTQLVISFMHNISKDSLWFLGRNSPVHFLDDNWFESPLVKRIHNILIDLSINDVIGYYL